MKDFTFNFTIILTIAIVVMGYMVVTDSVKLMKLEAKVDEHLELFDEFAKIHDENVEIYNEHWETQWEWNEEMAEWTNDVFDYLE